MSNVYHVSDLHLDHRSIAKYRAVSSMEENNELCVDRILTRVNKRDTLWMHGDICFTEDSLKYIEKIAEYVGYIHFVMGNHDFERMPVETKRRCLLKLASIVSGVYGLTRKNGAWMSHSPVHPIELRGYVNIHGHVHQHTIRDDRYVNVCVDNTNFYPISRDAIKAGWRTSV